MHRAFFFASLSALTVACGGSPPSGSDTGPTPTTDAPTSSCSCDITFNGASETIPCGTGTCFSSDDRWASCTATGEIVFGSRTCIQDAWDATVDTSFSCDGTITCGPGTYCAIRVPGPAPRRSECRPLPAGCTPPTDEQEMCDCLLADAVMGDVCAGTTSVLTCETFAPRTSSIGCTE